MAKRKQAEDEVIGRNVRRIRNRIGMSQEKLGDALGLTFQQVQKYEKGVNRLSGSRIVQVAKALNCTILDLFEGAANMVEATNREPDPCLMLGASQLGVRLARAFGRLPPKMQNTVVSLVEGVIESKVP